MLVPLLTELIYFMNSSIKVDNEELLCLCLTNIEAD